MNKTVGIAKTQKSGGNTYVNIPVDICKLVGLEKGDKVKVTGTKINKRIVIEKLQKG